ncbi:MAG: hypothetical protein U0103_16130 [Candidatus Obscuribacterales bacterium]|nr:hypothetical protein [Cyanobacteria bacterium SZAS LIN-5]RTL42506.1 MAG: hypothetical protein EKK48_10980 [Candidatus Melainabacteria bacterium]
MNISADMIAMVLTAAGDLAARGESYREAEKLYMDALFYAEECWGPKSFQVASLYAYLSDITSKLGKTTESALFMNRVEEINRIYKKAHSEPAIMDLLHSF